MVHQRHIERKTTPVEFSLVEPCDKANIFLGSHGSCLREMNSLRVDYTLVDIWFNFERNFVIILKLAFVLSFADLSVADPDLVTRCLEPSQNFQK